jgi:hypothetical protein
MNKKSADEVIKRLMEAFDSYDDSTLALKLNRDIATLRTWRSRDVVPLTVLAEAARATDYSLEWLKGVDGAQKTGVKRTPEDDRSAALLTSNEVDLLEKYRQLPPRLRDHVEDAALLAWLAYRDRKAYHDHINELDPKL